jgi:RNA polymerase sigma-70 factor (ECF subfamily)
MVVFAPAVQARRARFFCPHSLEHLPSLPHTVSRARGAFSAEFIDKSAHSAVFLCGKEKRFSLDGREPGEHRESDPLADAYDRYGARLYGYLVSVLHDTQAAEDVVQEVFCKLARRGAFWGIRDPERYLFRAAHNEARRWLTGDRNRTMLSMSDSGQRQVQPQAADPAELAAIERALRTLPPEQAEVIHLKVYERMTFERIGRLLRCSTNTAASRYRYACEKLRKMLGGPADGR